MESRHNLREMLEAPGIIMSPEVYDGISVKVVEQTGYKTAMFGGGAVSNTRLAKPDFGFINLTDMEEHVSKITQETDLAIQVDADTGYGNAVNVHHAIKILERAGASLIMIEDQAFPKRCGHFEGKSVVPAEDMVRKVEAAVDACENSETLILARTDSVATDGIEEAIHRLNMYSDRGADVLMADALLNEAQIKRVGEEVEGFTKVNMGFGLRERPTTPLLTPKNLEKYNIDMVSYGRITRAAAVKGMLNALNALKTQKDSDKVTEREDLLVNQEEYTEMLGLDAIKELESKYA